MPMPKLHETAFAHPDVLSVSMPPTPQPKKNQSKATTITVGEHSNVLDAQMVTTLLIRFKIFV
jgi:hypothetical protein